MSTDKTFELVIHNVLGQELQPDMLAALLDRVKHRYATEYQAVEVYPAQTNKHGTTEWTVSLHRDRATRIGGMVVGMLQRSLHAEVEFHS